MHKCVPRNKRRLPAIAVWLAVALLICGLPRSASGDAFTIEEWGLTTGIFNYATGEHPSRIFTLVQNPFRGSHFVSLGDSCSTSSYDFGWWEANGTFFIQSSQQAEGVPTSLLLTSASGFIYVTPTEDLPLAIDASWTFNLPRYYMDTTLRVNVYGLNSHVNLFNQFTGGQTSYPDPASGTVALTGNIVLPPSDTWVLRYEMNIYTFSGTQGYTATGNGYVNFRLSPEPAAFSLLVFGSLLLRRGCPQRH